jgi:hypothetical protein
VERGHPVRQRAEHAQSSASVYSRFALNADKMSALHWSLYGSSKKISGKEIAKRSPRYEAHAQ